MRTTRLFFTLTLTLALTSNAWAFDFIHTTVASCAASVRHTPTSSRYEAELLYDSFDAYYDETTRDFNFYGSKRARYLFEKCMSQHGLSLVEAK